MTTYNFDSLIRGLSFSRSVEACGIERTEFSVDIVVEASEARLILNEAALREKTCGGLLPLLFNDDMNKPIGTLHFSDKSISVSESGSKKEMAFRGELNPNSYMADDLLKLMRDIPMSFGLQCEQISKDKIKVWSASFRMFPTNRAAIVSERPEPKKKLLTSKVKCTHCDSPNNLERERCNSCGCPLEFDEENIVRVYE